MMLADDRRSWQLGPDAAWRRTEDVLGRPGTIDTFAEMKKPRGGQSRSRPSRLAARPGAARSIRGHEPVGCTTRLRRDRSRSS